MLISQLVHSAFWGESSAHKLLSSALSDSNKKHQVICVFIWSLNQIKIQRICYPQYYSIFKTEYVKKEKETEWFLSPML